MQEKRVDNTTQKKKDNKFKLTYTPVGKSTSLAKELLEIIPPQFKATNKTGYFFSSIFIIVIAIGVINSLMPLLDLDLSFSTDPGTNETKAFELNVNVGIPLTFFGSDIDPESQISMSPLNLIIDLTLYLLLAYILDVIINFIFTLKITPSKEELKRKPREIQIQKKSISEKATEKIVEKVTEKITGRKQPAIKQQAQQTTPTPTKPSPTTQTTNNTTPNKPVANSTPQNST